MMSFFKTVGQLIQNNSAEIAVDINRALNNEYHSLLHEGGLSNDIANKRRAHLVGLIGRAILNQNGTDVAEEVTDWTKETARVSVEQGIEMEKLIIILASYKTTIWKYIRKEIEIDQIKSSTVLAVHQFIEDLLDQILYLFNATYINYYKQKIASAKKAFNEVSFPVVALSDKVAILPLIGELDEERASIILENVLPKCKDLKIDELILDLSGVPRIDTISANTLFQLKDSLAIIGISLTFTGIKPELAVPMVNLGIPINKLHIKGTLKNAIATSKVL
ncbi:STAS domain-containing protein [Domibacillus indicus]|uniref:STAS domain-containing protein n=1 Tax=Domibacillus indicus TaxID=1437523 RepID=UPI00203A84DE|nr:STAS domain-containing protein [Domibacillus indicus]MCM3789896.1 STAS domain-containing protein [Domibacillus indicus]